MAHLLHIDSSIQGDRSISRRLTALAADRWRTTHPDGTVTYRDLAAEPVPHLDAEGGMGLLLPPDQHTLAQAATYGLAATLIGEVKQADTVLLGLPLYNFGPPSTVKAWVDHLTVAGLSFDPATTTGLLAGRDLIVLESRGGGYGAGTPREGWDHAEAWLHHGVSMTGLKPRFITAELTLAETNPAMTELRPLAARSIADAEAAIDQLWAARVVA
jgi:FMN-dependent NADH-azoreductase